METSIPTSRPATPSPRVAAALALAARRADDVTSRHPVPGDPPAAPRFEPGDRRWFAIGDPQAPVEHFLEILDHRTLLDDSGWLRRDVGLISMGDHFDWGGASQREQAARSGLELLAWLAAHPADQVILILGNHDLGRVGELVGFDDDAFALAHDAAVRAYRDGDVDVDRERELLERFPALPTAELAARDFAAFSSAQRDLIIALLRVSRLRVAVARGAMLLCHAGVTIDDIAAIPGDLGPAPSAATIAEALQRTLDERVARWTSDSHEPGIGPGGGPGRAPIDLPGLHRPGDREFGEGGGIFYHRPSNPEHERDPRLFAGRYARRYDARRVPRGIVQIIGHIGDEKCRKLLGPWADGPAASGALRHLEIRGTSVRYQAGLPATWPTDSVSIGRRDRIDPDCALMIFTDGGMRRTSPERYELLELPVNTGVAH